MTYNEYLKNLIGRRGVLIKDYNTSVYTFHIDRDFEGRLKQGGTGDKVIDLQNNFVIVEKVMDEKTPKVVTIPLALFIVEEV